MPYKIMWFSRHKPLPSQKKELKRIFGKDTILVIDNRVFKNAREIIERMNEFKIDDIVVVAPLTVIKHLTEAGIKPIWAEMKVCNKSEAETEANGRYYKFVKFRRIKSVKVEFEEL